MNDDKREKIIASHEDRKNRFNEIAEDGDQKETFSNIISNLSEISEIVIELPKYKTSGSFI